MQTRVEDLEAQQDAAAAAAAASAAAAATSPPESGRGYASAGLSTVGPTARS